MTQQGKISGTLCTMDGETQCQALSLTVDYPQQLLPVDYLQSGKYFGIAFTTVVFLYLFSRAIGIILKLVKDA